MQYRTPWYRVRESDLGIIINHPGLDFLSISDYSMNERRFDVWFLKPDTNPDEGKILVNPLRRFRFLDPTCPESLM